MWEAITSISTVKLLRFVTSLLLQGLAAGTARIRHFSHRAGAASLLELSASANTRAAVGRTWASTPLSVLAAKNYFSCRLLELYVCTSEIVIWKQMHIPLKIKKWKLCFWSLLGGKNIYIFKILEECCRCFA